ncbi:hypothetical protein ADK65_24820 [Streptomyces sp. NRRL B-1140]|uniref:hypothetical protein n=1 Tax=Streptomyces sp. NRRL B-1140 TaxID=1415549 RepID=UPI0006ADC5A6|nr:hypothetical protein [Streptomyces sp. NRRL B-1140]KOV97722.1 hypothetical protein ADK65_24820 [Streptomyces sp. NRRL B-1140]
MSETYVLPTLVKGPFPLPERWLVVNVGWLAVIFRNGVPFRVCGPGRHSTVTGLFTGRRLPATGELSVLLFDNAPQTVEMSADAVRLADARKVGVSAIAVVQPRWSSDPGSLLDVVARYGVLSSRYGEAAGVRLDADFRAWARRLLRERGHDDVYLAVDSRTILAGPPGASTGPGGGLLVVEQFVDVDVTPDPVVLAVEDAQDKVAVKVAKLEAGIALEPLRALLIDLRKQYADQTERAHSMRRAELDVDVAAVYDVIPLFMRDPEAAGEVVKARWETLTKLLGEYADTLPFAAEELKVTPTQLLQNLAQGRVPAPSGDSRGPSPDEIGELDERRRSA